MMDGFIVWRVGAREPEIEFDRYILAANHAKELAKKHPGAEYYVFEVVSVFKEGK